MYDDSFLDKKLEERRAAGALRRLSLPAAAVDFCSNDYLGLARSGRLAVAGGFAQGSTGSRLLAGNYALIEELEVRLADFHQAGAALLFNSGYDANVGLLSCIAGRGDTILYDYLSHASIRDGIRLSFARSHSFAHNDLEDLEKKLQRCTGNRFVVTESVFSMDGDCCPLQQLVSLCRRYQAHLIIDEAHATGVLGQRGEGLVQSLGLQHEVFCRVHTFGKALGCHGAVVLGSDRLRQYLVNFARSFMYSTALPAHDVAVIARAYDLFPGMESERRHLQQLVARFRETPLRFQKLASDTPIQAVVVPGNEAVKSLAATLQQQGFDVRPILYPTVPRNTERLRIVLHAFNTHEELGTLLQLLC